jgi:HAD superfamily hydrolase (TIGR01509 family)
MAVLCLIFDLDGTLVDSEGLCNRAFLDLLPEIDDTVDSLIHRYRGKKMALIFADIEQRLHRKLPVDFESRYRQRVSELFRHNLKPSPGVREMLEAITYPCCVASSGPMAKVKESLQLSGLVVYFGDNIFSSYEVGSWKPDPGLFLHAADSMGFQPAHCVVIEDSTVGMEAAAAAGMRALQYLPDGRDTHFRGGVSFNDMLVLPNLLRQIADEQAGEPVA